MRHLLAARDGAAGGAPEEYWTGTRWSPDMAAGHDHGSWQSAEAAREEMDSDRDVFILVVVETGLRDCVPALGVRA